MKALKAKARLCRRGFVGAALSLAAQTAAREFIERCQPMIVRVA